LSTTRWLTRDDLGRAARTATGLLQVAPDASSAWPLGEGDGAAALELTAGALAAAGAGGSDRVVVALAEPAGSLWAAAGATVASASASVGPRGRMRLHHALRSLGATTLVITPTGAMDFLARLHLEFLLDPLDLGLRNIVLTGEIASRRTMGHLAGEFEARVTEVYANPYSGAALAWRDSDAAPLTPLADDLLSLASLDKDSPFEGSAGLAELVLTPIAHSSLGDAVVRTGQVARAGEAGGIPAPCHTVGDHVMVRGVWLSLARVEKALSKIDGVSGWELAISRQGTLDAATLKVWFNRAGLVGNPMWRSRIEQSLAGLTPVKLGVEVATEVAETPRPGTVADARGHHLGRDRTAIAH
jgi:phenylacetate-CoA ligase